MTYAREFAINAHEGQMYGSNDYVHHLDKVVENVKRWTKHPFVINAAYLHDVLEDTDVDETTLRYEFGSDTYDIVDRVTDKEGRNRKERHLNTYYLIRKNRYAVLVKLSDRLANQDECIRTRNVKKGKMYVKEYDYFKFALYEPEQWDEAWTELDAQVKVLVKMVSEGN